MPLTWLKIATRDPNDGLSTPPGAGPFDRNPDPPMSHFRLHLLASFFVLLASGCGGGGGGGSSISNQVSGTLSLPATSSGTVLEAEPNDTTSQAHDLGTIAAGESIVVLGDLTDDGSDPFDGFALTASARVAIDVNLSFDVGADLDVRVYDSIPMQFVETFDSTASGSESGSFIAKGAFQIVLNAFAGSTSYSLTISASAPANPIAEVEPNDLPGEATYLGEAVAGDGLSLVGSIDSASDTNDRWVVVFPDASQVHFDLGVPAGADFELDLNDVTNDLGSPVDLLMSSTGTGVDVSLDLAVGAMTALELVVVAEAGSGAYTLDLSSAAGISGQDGLVARRVTPLSLEGGGPKRDSAGLRFGQVSQPLKAGELLLSLEAGVDPLAFAAQHGLRWIDGVPQGVQRFAMTLHPSATNEDHARQTSARVNVLKAASGVRFAEPNWMLQRKDVPSDPFFNLQWHYPLIQIPAAWDLTIGSSQVITAVIDTGELMHPDLVANLIPGYDFISDSSIALDGNGRDSDPTDEGDGDAFQPSSFHGTHVAGTIGAVTDNGIGVSGINRLGKIMHLRTLGKGGGTTFDILNAVLYAARLPNASNLLPAAQADIINMSLGGPGFSQAFQDACTQAFDAGTIIFAAAGNENSSQPSYPAAYDKVVSVSAVDQNSMRAPYSNFHPTVDIAAPGGNTGADLDGDGYADGVLSTLADDSSSSLSFNYVFYQGTSMACPHAAGVAGLILAADPTLTPAQIESLMESTATDLGSPGKDDIYGNGLINAYQAVLQATGGAPTDPVLGLSTQSLSFSSSANTLSVSVSNLGGGLLQVQNVSTSTSSGGNWLSASAVPSQGSTSSDTASIAVDANSAGLPDGTYTGSVQVDTNATAVPSGTIAVVLTVAPNAPPNVEVFMLAVEVDSAGDFTTAAQVIVNPATGLDYSFSNLEEGSYLLVAGTDVNDDGFICDDGELFCGAYPTLDETILVDVAEGDDLQDLDFILVSSDTDLSSSSTGGFEGFRLLEDE